MPTSTLSGEAEWPQVAGAVIEADQATIRGRGIDLGARPRQDFEPDVPLTQGLNHADEVGEGASESIEFPHYERIAWLEGFQTRHEAGPCVLTAGGVILVESLGRDPSRHEGIPLEVEALGPIAFGDPHI